MITHPDKILFPQAGISKGELAAYYEAVAPALLPHLAGRPITLERYPGGIEGKGFIQKDVSRGFPAWLERVAVPRKGGGFVHYALARDTRALLWLANQNCITPHVWMSRAPELESPDWCVIDLDPPDEDPRALRRAALATRDLLAELGLSCWIKTSGSKGFHIVIPLDGHACFEDTWRFAHGVGAVLVQRDPEHLTQEFIKAERGGRILVDTGRNGAGATLAAAYAVRARPRAPVSAPCTWQEVEAGVEPQSFLLRDLRARLDRVGDLWAELPAAGQSLREPLERLERLLSPEIWEASLAAATRRPKPRRRTPR